MKREDWLRGRNDRSLRYTKGRVFDEATSFTISGEQAYIRTFSGQVAALTLVNILARMTDNISVALPEVDVVPPLPWAGESLTKVLRKFMFGADPKGRFKFGPTPMGTREIFLGQENTGWATFGVGWNAYYGPSPATPNKDNTSNPVGPAMAAIITVASLFNEICLNQTCKPAMVNCLDWSTFPATQGASDISFDQPLGKIWLIGAGSVGTSALFFLTLTNRAFSCDIFDMDKVKLHNLDRSPIFFDKHRKEYKAEVLKEYLEDLAVKEAKAYVKSLGESGALKARKMGTPDIFISAANEHNVRNLIENNYPPIQIYGTTGTLHQAAMIRHIPLIDPCSNCLFPTSTSSNLSCATGTIQKPDKEEMDASLPFLSFAAGLMAAAEIFKLQSKSYPFTPNRTVLNTYGKIWTARAPQYFKDQCLCKERSKQIYEETIGGTTFSHLSFPFKDS